MFFLDSEHGGMGKCLPPSPPPKKKKQKVMTIKWALLNINNCDKNNDKEF